MKSVFPLKALLLFLFVTINSLGATVYVDYTLTATSSTTYNPATRQTGSGSTTAYKTLAAASASPAPGTIILVRAGTYPEAINPKVSGTAANPIVYRNYTNEIVQIKGATAITLTSRNYIVIDGFHAEDTRWLESNDSHYNIIQNCIFKRTPASGTTGNVRFIQSHFNQVLNNHIESGQDNLLFIDSNYNLAEGNTILEGKHSLFGIRCGDGNVIRANYFSNTLQKIGEVYDCGADTTAVPDSFDSTARNVIEDNIFAGTVKYYSSSGGNGIQYAGQRGIIRYNVFYDCNIGLGMQTYGDEALYNNDNRIYNNTFYNNAGAGIATHSDPARNIYKNNILVANQGSIPDCFGVSPGQLIYRTTLGQSCFFEANDIFYQAAGQPVIESEFNSGKTIAQAMSSFPGVLTNTLEFDPLFVDVANYDFALKPASPLINKGAFLTKTTSAGSGTLIPVADASYFYNGARPSSGDIIQLQGQSITARVTSLDLVNNIVTVDKALTWTAGQGFTLTYSGAAPDIGAFEHEGDISAPTVSLISPSSGATITGATTVSANATDDVGVTGVQFQLDGSPLGTEVTVAPFQVTWNSTATLNGVHQLTAVARDASGKTTVSTAISVTVSNIAPPSAPAAPKISTTLATVATSPIAQINLQWNAVPGATSYRIKRSTSPTGSLTVVASGLTALTGSNLAPATGTTYYYVITAVNAAGESLPSVAVATRPRTPAPRFTELIAISSNELTLSWVDASRDENGFALEISTNGSAWAPLVNTPANSAAYTIANLTANTVYWFRLRAYKGSVFSPYSAVRSVKTLP